MEQDKAIEISDYAQRRMSSRGLSDYHIWFCMFHHRDEYKVGRETVWVCKLPDGRQIKVRIEDVDANPIVVKDAFTYR